MKKNYSIHMGVWITFAFLFAGFFCNTINKIAISVIIGIIVSVYIIFIILNLYYNNNIKRKKVYLAGPYTGTDEEIKNNILKACNMAKKLRNQGFNVFLPHSNFIYCDDLEGTEQGRREIMLLCKEWIDECDLFALMPGWQKSKGARGEYAHAQVQRKEIIYLT